MCYSNCGSSYQNTILLSLFWKTLIIDDWSFSFIRVLLQDFPFTITGLAFKLNQSFLSEICYVS